MREEERGRGRRKKRRERRKEGEREREGGREGGREGRKREEGVKYIWLHVLGLPTKEKSSKLISKP